MSVTFFHLLMASTPAQASRPVPLSKIPSLLSAEQPIKAHGCAEFHKHPLSIANAINRQWAAELAWNLTDRTRAGDTGRWYLPGWLPFGYGDRDEFVPFVLMRLPHTKLEVWGPPSWQYRYQARVSVERNTLHVVEAITGSCGNGDKDNAPLVLEIGANEGAFGRVASANGCRVISVEPQPA